MSPCCLIKKAHVNILRDVRMAARDNTDIIVKCKSIPAKFPPPTHPRPQERDSPTSPKSRQTTQLRQLKVQHKLGQWRKKKESQQLHCGKQMSIKTESRVNVSGLLLLL